jgi:hypothetical protein
VPLFTEPASVQLHDAHPAARAPSIDVCDLFDEPWCALPESTPLAWNRYWVCADQRGGMPPIAGSGRTITEVTSLVAFRHLVALVPGSTERQAHPGVVNVPARSVPPFRVAVVYPGSAPGPLTEAFVETAVDVTRSAVSLVPGAERLV